LLFDINDMRIAGTTLLNGKEKADSLRPISFCQVLADFQNWPSLLTNDTGRQPLINTRDTMSVSNSIAPTITTDQEDRSS